MAAAAGAGGNIIIAKSLEDLAKHEPNPYQKAILNKVLTREEDDKIYLAGYNPNTDPKKKDIIGTIHIYGTYSYKKNKRETYEVKIYNKSPKGTLYCSCADCKFNGVKNGTSCKHISFIVTKILKLYDLNFFITKILTENQIAELINKLTSGNVLNDKDIIKKLEKITIDTYRAFVKEITEEDECPICCGSLIEDHKTNVCCLQCKNEVHFECVGIWLERHNTCVYCRSETWKDFNFVKNGGEVIKN